MYWTYKVEIFIDEKEESECGFVEADSFAGAAEKIGEYYGDDLETVTISILSPDRVLVWRNEGDFDRSVEEIKKGVIW